MFLAFERESRRNLFLICHSEDDRLELDFPGELYEAQVRDALDRIFFVELKEEDEPARKLVMGAYFPVGDTWYGAYYERGGDQHSLFFLRVIGEGELTTLEAVEQEFEHQAVAQAFSKRYSDVLA